MQPTITVYGAPWCPDCHRAKQFLGEHRVAYRWVDVDTDPDGVRRIEELNGGRHSIPVILFADETILVEPTNAELATKLGLQTRAMRTFYDLVVVGGGPAGITAAIYAAREGIATLIVERSSLGGQAAITERLDNYPGFPDGVTGEEFRTRLVAHAHRFGVELLSAQEVTGITVDGPYRAITMADGTVIGANAILLAPGSTYQRLNVPGEEDFLGAGIHFCATCDGPFYRGQEVAVIGGGNSAAEESLFLTRFASHVTILVRGDALSASAVVREKVAECDTITMRPHTVVEGFAGTKSQPHHCPRAGHGLRRDGDTAPGGGLRLHRPAPEHAVPHGGRDAGRARLHRDGRGVADDYARRFRCGRRARWQHQAGGVGGR